MFLTLVYKENHYEKQVMDATYLSNQLYGRLRYFLFPLKKENQGDPWRGGEECEHVQL